MDYFSSFGYIGGVGGYPITTKPTTTTQVSSAAVEESFGARERRLRRDEELRRDGAHHFPDARLVPALAREVFEVAQGKYAV